MGAGIASIGALAGFDIHLNDITTEQIEQALARIGDDHRKRQGKGELSEQQCSEAQRRIHRSESLNDLKDCSFVIEAAVEELEAKRKIFKQLEESCSPEAILASNTSSLSITSIAGATRLPHRVVGMHFFNPPQRMKLVEIVRGHHTDDITIEQTKSLATALGKVSIVVKDTPGFIVNRIARPFYGEALKLLGEGVASVEEIDRILKLEGGFKMGPFELMDLIGIDVNLSVTQSIYEQTFHEPRYRPHSIQRAKVAAGLLGKKSGEGFYSY